MFIGGDRGLLDYCTAHRSGALAANDAVNVQVDTEYEKNHNQTILSNNYDDTATSQLV